MTALLSVAAIAALSRPPPPPTRTTEGPLLPRPGLLHVLGASEQNLVADYFWIQMIQQIGRAKTADEYRDIFDYANLVTDLDPYFKLVYAYAATSVPYARGREQWANTKESTRILEKGLKAFPSDPQLRFYLAYNLQYFDRRFREAARIIQDLSQLPGQPAYMAQLATRLYAQGGDFDAGLAFAQALRDSATDPDSRDFFDHRIKEIHQERVLQRVEAAVAAFRKREHRLPLTVEELLMSRDLDTVPQDPLGGSIRIDGSGHAQSSATEHRLRLYRKYEDEPPEGES